MTWSVLENKENYVEVIFNFSTFKFEVFQYLGSNFKPRTLLSNMACVDPGSAAKLS